MSGLTLRGKPLHEYPLPVRLRVIAQHMHAGAAWGFAGEGLWLEQAADQLEQPGIRLSAHEMEALLSALQHVQMSGTGEELHALAMLRTRLQHAWERRTGLA